MKIFENVANLKASKLTAGQLTTTKGFYQAGDGGGATYLIKTSADYGGTPDEYRDHTISGGTIAVLQIEGLLNVQTCGARGDGATDDTAALQAALNASVHKTVHFGNNSQYKITAQLNVYGSIEGNGATILPYGTDMGTVLNAALSKTKYGSIKNLIIDGTNCSSIQYAIFADVGLEDQVGVDYYDVVIKNISNSNDAQGCNGLLIYRSSSAFANVSPKLNITATVSNIIGTANGVGGDSAGSAKGIVVAFNGNGTDANVVIHNSTVDTVTCGAVIPNEDSDGIHISQADYRNNGKGSWKIQNCYVKGAAKRGVKVQTVNTIVENVVVEADGTDAAFETYGEKTTFTNCRALNATAACFTTDYTYTVFDNCYGEGKSTAVDQRLMRLYSSCDNVVIRNCTLISNATHTTNSFGILDTDLGKLDVDGLTIKGATSTASAILIGGLTVDCRMTNLRITGVEYGLRHNYCAGSMAVSDSLISTTSMASVIFGNKGFPVSFNNCTLIASSSIGIAVYADYSVGVHTHTVTVENCNIYSEAFGVLGASNSRYVNNTLYSSLLTGYGIMSGNSVYRGNQITGYDYALAYQYSTTAEVANNVSIGAGTGIAFTLGYTPFVDHDNYVR